VSAERLLFVRGGRAYLADRPAAPDAGRPLLPTEPADVVSAAFGVEPRTALLSRQGSGIWLLDTLTGVAQPLAEDGRRPRWLP
jgi:hypothetical protein